MSILAKHYSSFLTSVYNYKSFINDLKLKFGYVSDYIEHIIDDKFVEIEDNYPKYQTSSKIIVDISSYNLMKIYNVSSDGTNYLLNLINKQHIISLKPLLDSMPCNRKNLLQDFFVQTTYFESMQDIYDQSVFFNLRNEQTKVFYPYLFNTSFNSLLDEGSFLQIFLIQNIINQTFLESCNFLSKSTYYFANNDIVTKQVIQDEFNGFVSDNQIEISNNLISLILKTVYQFPSVSQNIIDQLSTEITLDILEISNLFNNFSDVYITDPVLELCKTTNNALSNILSIEITKDIFNDSTYFDQVVVQDLQQLEYDIINDYKSKMSSTNIKEYFYLLFYYKFWPFKFLNIIPYIIKNYVDNFLKPEEESSIDDIDFENYLTEISNSGNLTDINSYLENTIDNSYLVSLNNSYEITYFVYCLYFIEKLDLFFETDEFDTFIENILNKIFVYLKSYGYVEKNFNWYKNNKIVNVYFKSYFRKAIVTNTLFNSSYESFNENINKILFNTTGDSSNDIEFSFTESKLELTFNDISSEYESINLFFENHITSSLIAELINTYTSYFLIDYDSDPPAGIDFWNVDDDFEVE